LKYIPSYGTSIDTTCKFKSKQSRNLEKLTNSSQGNNIDIIVWSEIETYTAVICSCVMCIRPLFYHFLPSLFHTTQSDTASHSARGTGKPNWVQKICSKLRQSPTRHEILDEEDGGSRTDRARKAGKIMVTTESSVSYELNHRDVPRRLGNDGGILEDASEVSTENLHAQYKTESNLA